MSGMISRTLAAARTSRCGVCLLAAVWLVAGCGEDGPQRYEVNGHVTFRGKPVPLGYITFEPDSSKGNVGPQGKADIVDGAYRTPPGKGATSGPQIIYIDGFDGVRIPENEEGKALFPTYKTTRELPAAPSEQSFEVK